MGVEYPRTSSTRLLGRPLALGLDRCAVGYFTPVDPQAEAAVVVGAHPRLPDHRRPLVEHSRLSGINSPCIHF
jgi:hypothetical protein